MGYWPISPTAVSVIEYRQTHGIPAPMVHTEPEGPPQGARPERREGPRTKGGRVRKVEAPRQGVMREQIVRGSEAGSVVRRSEATHTLPVSHLESTGIEAKGQLPPSSLSFSAPRLEPIDDFISLTMTRVISSAAARGVNGPAGTPIVTPTSIGLRGLGGSPTTTIITPVVTVGGATSTVVTTTGSLGDPGVSHPEFVSREFLDDTLKAVHSIMRSEMREEVDVLKRMIKGKAPMLEPEPLPPTPPPSHTPNDLSIDDFKTL
ncbi:hypothetical protein L6452_13736 [Arctium lappa]|uniref:Uncharacterized protein n=1 Tax=Arctium lappa TaxID=4217 RepID=A0ACB9CJ15_ARCLA|nr:hypothetical protein L6452_13736 [Arctium lappa]